MDFANIREVLFHRLVLSPLRGPFQIALDRLDQTRKLDAYETSTQSRTVENHPGRSAFTGTALLWLFSDDSAVFPNVDGRPVHACDLSDSLGHATHGARNGIKETLVFG